MTTQPWTRHYDKGVSPSLKPYPEKTLVDVVRSHAEARPDRPAFYFMGEQTSWNQLEKQSNALARALVGSGLQKGERVALLMPNSPQMIVAEFAIWKAGGVVVPLNPLYTSKELHHTLNECGAVLAIVLTPFYTKVASIRARTSLRMVIAARISRDLPFMKRHLFCLLKEKKEGHRPLIDPGDSLLEDLIATGNAMNDQLQLPSPADNAIFLFSGGTTGEPKCAVCTHQSLVISGSQISAWFGVVLEPHEDIIMLNMPLFHVYAQVGIFGAAMMGGYAAALVPNPRDLDDLIKVIRRLGPAVLPGVPTLFNALLRHPRIENNHRILRSLKLCVSGAAPLLSETRKRFAGLTGGSIIDAYSLTEAMLASVLNPVLGTPREGAVGIPAPDVELKIVDPVNPALTLDSNQPGEILLRAPQLMEGYWQRHEETVKILKDGWLYTGDIGYMDEDGYLYIIDRKKDLIKPGGFQVWPREVEEVIASFPGITEAGVAGIPDSYQGEAVKAWVVVTEGFRLDTRELKEYCRDYLAPYKIPRYIEVIDSLPKTSVGKVLRRALVEQHCQASAHDDH
ncbi:AMP-dependent synthetase and ligase [Prosthecochloris aestuarii DSM 271]|uniref:AMP-dependent synthetase and ligase n=1 Tax=Prosthecochloris aestuarii (strain DSM 271 / SK 413) TaxID=290512 RepID=B4S7Q4_PROA2|nr:AMP-binding protein [Prosthecochloris aestuarii]ACF46091.1 AMP-dependent synthetase and ligase [Prosthecochloris aestuarii DSM 271]